MSNAANHIIQKEVIDLQYNGSVNEFELQHDTDRLKDNLNLGIEALFDRLNIGDNVCVIDKLEIDVFDTEQAEWIKTTTDKILQKLEAAIQKQLQQPGDAYAILLPVKERQLQSLIYYLAHGYLPWNAEKQSASDWKATISDIIKTASGRQALQQLTGILKNETAVRRLVDILDEAAFWQLIQILSGGESATVQNWKHDEAIFTALADSMKLPAQTSSYRIILLQAVALENSIPAIDQKFAAGIWRYFMQPAQQQSKRFWIKRIQNTALVSFIEEKKKALRKPPSKKAVKNNPAPDAQNEDLTATLDIKNEMQLTDTGSLTSANNIYINNAGIVIVGPYLPALFKRAEIVKDTELTDIPRAITLMHHIVTGGEAFAEYEVPLFKLLAGVDIETYVAPSYKLTTEDRELVSSLLQSVILHWDKIKNTSIPGLQSTFLQREGKLSINDDKNRLVVHRGPFDILLESLPWSISMIKMPWMKKLLAVEWL